MQPKTPGMVRYNRIFNCLDTCIGSWAECICDGKLNYIRANVRQDEECEQAASDAFLSDEIEV